MQKGSVSEVRREGVSPHSKRCRLPLRPPSLESILWERCCAHAWTLRSSKRELRARRSKTAGGRKPGGSAPFKCQTATRAGLSASLSVGLPTHTLPPCFTLPLFHCFLSLREFISSQPGAPGPCHWPLVPAARVARMQHSHASA